MDKTLKKELVRSVLYAIVFFIALLFYDTCDRQTEIIHYSMPSAPTEEFEGGYWSYDFHKRIWVKKYFSPDRTMGTKSFQGYGKRNHRVIEDELEDYLEDHVEDYEEDNYWGETQGY